MRWKVVTKTKDPTRRQTDSSGSNLPGQFSIHIVVGLDNNELDWTINLILQQGQHEKSKKIENTKNYDELDYEKPG